MFEITYNGIITLNRGDSFEMPLIINAGSTMSPIKFVPTDRTNVYFGVMEPNQPFEYAIIKKKYTKDDCDEDGNIVVKFRPQDTQCVLPGKYYYQVKVQTFNSDDPEDYDVSTVVDKTQFYILE